MDKNILSQYIDACELIKETEEEIKKLKDLLGDPTHILGNANTKHGEIAEYLEANQLTELTSVMSAYSKFKELHP